MALKKKFADDVVKLLGNMHQENYANYLGFPKFAFGKSIKKIEDFSVQVNS